ncbi:MAG: SWIM zinc finger family protein, partial [Armatimonadota bacterium]
QAWCQNLERYSDFSNRLPRGRTYVRNGSVIDLQMSPGTVTALVSGSEIYDVQVNVTVVPKPRWRAICRDCTGAIDSLVELLQGRLSRSVMARICEPKTGLFPSSKEISFQCSCPDWAWMCKHVAAVLYGVGARLDKRPELLFLLRSVDQNDLIAKADTGLRSPKKGPAAAKVLDSGDLSQIFGIEIAQFEPPAASDARRKGMAKGTTDAKPAAATRAAQASPKTAKCPMRSPCSMSAAARFTRLSAASLPRRRTSSRCSTS